MPFFKDALLLATYNEGKPPRGLTPAHDKAEHHRFKTEFLFNETAIPKAPYVLRLIQHYLLLRAIEEQLKNLPAAQKAELNPFFTLDYLDQLWRTAATEEDLNALGVEVASIKDKHIAPATKTYLELLPSLNATNLLAHFLFHLAGFMHGGSIIKSRIEKSNQLTDYEITSQQYDFSAAKAKSTNPNSFALFNDMMKPINQIILNEQEFQDVITQGQTVYSLMSNIYDDLCVMYTNQHQPTMDTEQHPPITHANPHQSLCASLSVIGLGVALMGFVFSALGRITVASTEIRPN